MEKRRDENKETKEKKKEKDLGGESQEGLDGSLTF